MPSSKEIHLIPDTNALIHYRFFDIGWCELLKADAVHIHIAPVVLDEIAKAKDMGASKALRNRAATLCKKFDIFFEKSAPHLIRLKEELHFHDEESDFEQHPLLNQISKDDHLIAFALDLQSKLKCVLLVATSDVSFKLRVRLKRFKLANVQLPDAFRLQISDDEDKKLLALQNELQTLKNSQPRLTLCFQDGTNLHRENLDTDVENGKCMNLYIEEIVAEAKKKHPFQSVQPVQGLLASVSRARETPESAARFNERLNEYYARVRCAGILKWQLWNKQIKITLTVKNEGSAPAHSVFVNLHFPDGFQVLSKEQFMDMVPKQPTPPLTKSQAFMESLKPLPYHPMIQQSWLKSETGNRGPIQIKKSNSYDVTMEFTKIRQGEFEKLDEIHVLFTEVKKSFEISYRILADNLPTPVEGKLHIAIEQS